MYIITKAVTYLALLRVTSYFNYTLVSIMKYSTASIILIAQKNIVNWNTYYVKEWIKKIVES